MVSMKVLALLGVLSTLIKFCESFLPGFDFGTAFDFSKFKGPVPTDPDVYRNVSELIASKGYPVEEHFVVTPDSYVLNIQRIPYGRKKPEEKQGKPVVLLQHGLLADSSCWVLNYPNNSFGYILADQGFDVWLANSRGNRYSRRNKFLPPSSPQFWKWSFDAMAKYDVPSTIDYILKKTGQQKFFYVGHSQGTLIGFASFSTYPEVAQKVELFVALAPIASIPNINVDLLRSLAKVATFIDSLVPIIDSPFLPGEIWRTQFIEKGFCNGLTEEKLCYQVFEYLVGNDDPNVDYSRIPVFFNNFPSGTSLRNMVHFAQLVVSGKCQMFDYGLIENLLYYNQFTPPEYKIDNMMTKTAIIGGSHDTLSDPKDVSRLIPKIKHLIFDETILDFNHFDFVLGKNARVKLYPTLVKLIEMHL